MHSVSVRYHRQLKTIEERNKMTIIENRFENEGGVSFALDNDFNTVCYLESEIDLDD